MKKKLFFSKAVNAGIGCMICALALGSLAGCHKKASPTSTIEYSNIMGIAEGTADFKSTNSPEINIKDIKSYVGQEIDYSSGIDVKNVENLDDFQMWVDATGVDIYTAGRYTATYQFIFGEKTLEKTIGITVLNKEEVSGGLSAENQGNASGENNSGSNQNYSNTNHTGEVSETGNNQNGGNLSAGNEGNVSGNNGDNINQNQGPSDGNNAGTPNGGSSDGNNTGTPNGGSNGSSSDGNNAGSSNGSSSNGNNTGGSNGSSSDGNNADNSTEHREIVTSSQSATKKPSTIGYANIELLSGKFVRLKCTSTRYIVSTRTDESQTVKNDRTYQVSKLVITFNTGEERVLETVEKAIS